MSYSLPSRNVLFYRAGNKGRVNLAVPVKRRRQCWRETRSRNSRPELIADDEQDALLPSRSLTGAWVPTNGRRHTAPRFRCFCFWFCEHIGPIDSAMPEKRTPRITLIRAGCGTGVAEKESAQTLLGRLQSGPCRIRSSGGFPGSKRPATGIASGESGQVPSRNSAGTGNRACFRYRW
jgi:hypothetical protein